MEALCYGSARENAVGSFWPSVLLAAEHQSLALEKQHMPQELPRAHKRT